jgi:hypothetical protein
MMSLTESLVKEVPPCYLAAFPLWQLQKFIMITIVKNPSETKA